MCAAKAGVREIAAIVFVAVLFVFLFVPRLSPAETPNFKTAGRVEGADRIMSLGVAVSGIVGGVLVREGERVHAAQTLVKLDCRLIEADLRGREAQLRAAQATFDRYRNGSRPDEITVGEAGVRFSTARADEAEKALERADAMQEGVTITTARMLEVKRDARIASAQLEEARAKLSLLRAGSREEDLRQAEAARDAAMAQVETGRVRLDQCVIRAPADGVVLDVLATPGQFVSTAIPQPLLRVLADGPPRVRTEIDVRDLMHVCLSQSASVATDAFPDLDIHAAVASVSPTVAARPTSAAAAQTHDSQVVPVLLELDRTAPSLPIGSIVTVRFDPCPSKS
jgi:multidrug resistance efflux pump